MKDSLKALVTSPIGQGVLADAQHSADGENPVCGDKLRFSLRREPDGGLCLGFVATACPATIAVASCAVKLYSGQPRPEGPPFAALHQMVTMLGGLSNFEGHALTLVESVLEKLYGQSESGN